MGKYLKITFLSLALLLSVVSTAQAALTESQVNAIIGLLRSFGAADSIIADVQANLTGQTPPSRSQQFCFNWNRNLRVEDVGEDVSALHRALALEGLSNLTGRDFTEDTAGAVVSFQEKYAREILTPNGLRNGTGYVGASTRAKLNTLYACRRPANPSITLISPNGGERLIKGQKFNISWTTTSVFPYPQVVITLVTGRGLQAISQVERIITNNTGNYEWKVPNVPLSGYVQEVSGGPYRSVNLNDQSEYKFLIQGYPYVGRAEGPTDYSDNYFYIVSSASLGQCTDSDGGKNLEVKGFTDGRVNGIGNTFSDISVASNGGSCSGFTCTSVAEGFCENGQVNNQRFSCPSGYSVDGRCATRSIVLPPQSGVTISVPQNGSSYRTGTAMTVNWSAANVSSTDWFRASLIRPGTSMIAREMSASLNYLARTLIWNVPTNLEAHDDYAVQIDLCKTPLGTVCGGGVSANSPTFSITTAAGVDNTAPTVPGGLVASSVQQNSIGLLWQASTDNVGVVGYKVSRNGVEIARVGNQTAYTNTGLNAGTSYVYTVSAFDANYNFSGIASVTVTTSVQEISRTLNVMKSGLGAGTVAGSGVNCGTDCSEVFSSAVTINLSATPASGSVFSGWSGDCVGSASCALTMSQDRSVTANFSSITANQGTLTFLSTTNPAGVRLLTLNLITALVDPFTEGITVPVTLTYSGTVPATNVSISGFQAPFNYAGGAYPGIGGTCGATITADCTIMVNYKPGQEVSPGVISNTTGYISHFISLVLTYDMGASVGKTDGPVNMIGRAQIPGDLALNIYGGGYGEMGSNFGSMLLGRTGYRVLSVANQLTSTGATYNTEIRNVSISLSPGPFSARNNTCGNVIMGGYVNKCSEDILFTPQSAGPYSITMTASYDTGINIRKTKTLQITGEGFAPDPAKNLLLVYNSLSPESTELKDYYIANRPGMASINVLALPFDGMFNEQGCYNFGYIRDGVPIGAWSQWFTQTPNCQNITREDFDTYMKTPIVNWITSHPEKDIRHIVMAYMPARIDPSSGNGGVAYALNLAMRTTGIRPGGGNAFPPVIVEDGHAGNGYFTHQEYPGTMALVTDLWVGSVPATKAYVDKLKSMWNSMPVKNVVISAAGTGRQGTSYYFEDTNSLGPTQNPFNGEAHRDPVHRVNPTAPITVTGRSQPFITTASDVSGYFSWGTNGGHTWHYANDGSVIFTGNSSWYPIMTYESYNGQWASPQGEFTAWFSANAFGGTNYSNTPAAAVSHVEEPSGVGVNSALYFQCWEKGHLFIDCAYISMRTAFMMPHGDPWITK